MPKYFKILFLVVFAISLNVAGTDYSEYEKKLNQLNQQLGDKVDTASLNTYIMGCKKVLDQLGIDNKIVKNKEEKNLVILPSSKNNKLNKLAYDLDKNYGKLVLEINPHVTRKAGAQGFYEADSHRFLINGITLKTILLSDTTFHHEIRHAMMTYRYLRGGVDTVFNYEMVSLNTGDNNDKNGYEDFLTLQELSTYPIEARQIFAFYQTDAKVDKEERLNDLESAILQSYNISKYVVELTEAFDVKNAEIEVFSEKYLGVDYRYLKAVNKDAREFTIPYFANLETTNTKELIAKSINKANELAYAVWDAADEAHKAFKKFNSVRTEENLKNLKSKVENLSAVSRSFLPNAKNPAL